MRTEFLKKHKKKMFSIAFILAIVIIIVLVCLLGGKKEEITAEATMMDMFEELEFSGDVEPYETKSIYSILNQVKVADVLVAEGDMVKKGDILIKLDSTMAEFEFKESQLMLQQAQSDMALGIADSKIDLKYASEGLENRSDPALLAKKNALHDAQAAFDATIYRWDKANREYNEEESLDEVDAQAKVTAAQNALANTKAEAQAKVNVAQILYNAETDGTPRKAELQAELVAAQTQAALEIANAEADLKAAKNVLEAANKNSLKTQILNNFDYHAAREALADAEADYLAAIKEAEINEEKKSAAYNKVVSDTSVQQRQLAMEKAQLALENYTIKAPCDGYVVDLAVKPGDTVSDKELLKVMNFESMKVVINVNEYDASSFRLGTKARIQINSTKEEFEGTVTKIAGTAEKINDLSYIKVTVSFTPAEGQVISSGIGATVYTIPEGETIQLCVPTAAINYDPETDEDYVWVVNGKEKERRVVETGSALNEFTAIISGLSEGDVVAYTPAVEEEM